MFRFFEKYARPSFVLEMRRFLADQLLLHEDTQCRIASIYFTRIPDCCSYTLSDNVFPRTSVNSSWHNRRVHDNRYFIVPLHVIDAFTAVATFMVELTNLGGYLEESEMDRGWELLSAFGPLEKKECADRTKVESIDDARAQLAKTLGIPFSTSFCDDYVEQRFNDTLCNLNYAEMVSEIAMMPGMFGGEVEETFSRIVGTCPEVQDYLKKVSDIKEAIRAEESRKILELAAARAADKEAIAKLVHANAWIFLTQEEQEFWESSGGSCKFQWEDEDVCFAKLNGRKWMFLCQKIDADRVLLVERPI